MVNEGGHVVGGSGGVDGFGALPMQMDIGGGHDLPSRVDGRLGLGGPGFGAYNSMPGQALLDIDMNQFDWAAMDWGLGTRPTW